MGKTAWLACHSGESGFRREIPYLRGLSTVFARLSALIQEFQPDRVAIEEVFYSVNAKSALKLGQVRGVALLAASSQKLQIGEYAPLTIKAAVVGYGRAEKEQVQLMVARLLCLAEIPEPADAADALAIAICDLHTQATLSRQSAAASVRVDVVVSPWRAWLQPCRLD